MTATKQNLLIVTEAALENSTANPLSPADKARINGVYRTYENLAPHLDELYNVSYLTPFDYPGPEEPMLRALFKRNTPFSLPQQNSIRLVLPSGDDIAYRMERIKPDHVHIATEGPLGFRMMLYCKKHDIPVSTAFHTNFQQYVREDGFHIPYVPKPIAAKGTLSIMTAFHKAADATMAATPELKDELTALGLRSEKIYLVSRGVDPDIFRLYPDAKPIQDYVLYVGRLAPGKGVETFCTLDTKGLKKIVVGTGPLDEKLRKQFPNVDFVGFVQGEALAKYYNGAKFFVLPSDTETFGITVIEALACGTPVIALDRGGHVPILKTRPGLGVMKSDLQTAFNDAAARPEQFLSRAALADHTCATRSWKQEALNFHKMVQSVALKPRA